MKCYYQSCLMEEETILFMKKNFKCMKNNTFNSVFVFNRIFPFYHGETLYCKI